jgi:hypothetical protein
MASLQPFWDFVVILSLLKFLKLSTFFKYLQTHLVGRNWSNYLIKIVRVGVGMFSFRCEVEFWVGRCHEVDLIYCFGESKLHFTQLHSRNEAQTSIKRLISSPAEHSVNHLPLPFPGLLQLCPHAIRPRSRELSQLDDGSHILDLHQRL